MNADQNKAVRLALDYLQQTTKQFTPSDAWTDADWAIWRKANPLQDQMDTISREILADSKGSKFMEVGRQIIEGADTPFSRQRGAWGIVEDAIHRRGFFRLWRGITRRSVLGWMLILSGVFSLIFAWPWSSLVGAILTLAGVLAVKLPEALRPQSQTASATAPKPQQQTPRPKLTSLTDSQIELLRDFMKERVDGFTSGQLYAFEGITPPHRECFLWFEIGYLLCLLTSDLESASDAELYWERIVPPLLRQLSTNLTDERMNQIAAAARWYRDRWMPLYLADDAPLADALGVTVLQAFNCDDKDDEFRREIVRLTAKKVLDDSCEFLNRYKAIV
jgi:hypothetical protein